MQQILRRIAIHYKLRPGKVKRFMEQGYTFIYFGVTGPIGLVGSQELFQRLKKILVDYVSYANMVFQYLRIL